MRKKPGLTIEQAVVLVHEFEKEVRGLCQQVALRYYYYRLSGMNKNTIALPSLKKEIKLPVILNQQEQKGLFAAPTLLKQRVALISPAGLSGLGEILAGNR